MGTRSLADLIDDRFGVPTEMAQSRDASNVGTDATRVLRSDPKRLSAVVVNLSANVVFIAPDNRVNMFFGIRLAPNGGALTLIWDEDFHVTGYEWFGVATAAASSIYTLELLAR